MMTFAPAAFVETAVYDPRLLSGTKRSGAVVQASGASAALIYGFSMSLAEHSEMREAAHVKPAVTTSTGNHTGYTVALTLLAVMALLFVVDWLVSAPILVGIGGLLGSAGCFIAASAKRKSVELRG